MALESELKYFTDHREELLRHHEKQFVLIKGDQFAGAYTTEAEAYKAGLEKFGNKPFLIKQVLKEETVAHFPALTPGLL